MPLLQVGALEGDLLQHLLHDGVQAAGADVLGALVDAGGEAGDLFERVVGEHQLDPLGFQQRRALLDERVFRLREDADEVRLAERLQLDADREAALQLGDHVAGLGDVEGAGGHEQDVVGADEAVAGVDGGALDDGQNVALHALAADVGAVAGLAASDLVHFVEEDDAAALDAFQRHPRHLVHVDQLLLLFLDEVIDRLADPHLALAAAAAEQAGQHVADVDVHLLHAGAAGDLKDGPLLLDVDLDQAVVELAGPQPLAQLLAGALDRVGGLRLRRHEQFQQPFLGAFLGAVADLFQPLRADHLDGDVHQVADHRLDVAPDVADLGELAGLDLEEGRVGQPGQPPRDLGLAHAGGADHENVLRHHLLGHLRLQPLAADAVAQRDGDGPLGVVLADDVLVQLADDLARSELVQRGRLFDRLGRKINDHQPSSSKVILSLV